jgi:hypothetical protein
MRGSVRQFALALLTVMFAVLWICGSAWHLANCADSCCVATDRDAGSHAFGKKPGDCCASHHASGGKPADCGSSHSQSDAPVSETPQPDSHDQRQCEICQLFAQSLTVVAVVTVEVSPEWVESFVCRIPLTVPECELIPATSRGPPLIA